MEQNREGLPCPATLLRETHSARILIKGAGAKLVQQWQTSPASAG
jgi:hypothetical protein